MQSGKIKIIKRGHGKINLPENAAASIRPITRRHLTVPELREAWLSDMRKSREINAAKDRDIFFGGIAK
jgi:hypothetical protein